MQRAIEKAQALIDAMGWIRKFRDKTIVVKLGGSVLDNASALDFVLHDIQFMRTVGMRPVVVHGAGSRITRAAQEAGIEPEFIEGRRITDDRTLAIVERILARETNEQLAEHFERLGGRAMTLNFQSTPVLFGEIEEFTDNQGNRRSLGNVGRITHVDRLVIENLCYAGQVPFIPSMCESPGGFKLNVNADEAAAAVAQELCAEKLVFLSDVPGVLENADDPLSVLSSLTPTQARRLMQSGAITRGMIPKIEACLKAIDHGVRQVQILDARFKHALLLEAFVPGGIGTAINSENCLPDFGN